MAETRTVQQEIAPKLAELSANVLLETCGSVLACPSATGASSPSPR